MLAACWVFFFKNWRLLIFFKINVFKKFFEEYHQSVKQSGSRSGPTECQPDKMSSLIWVHTICIKIISRRH